MEFKTVEGMKKRGAVFGELTKNCGGGASAFLTHILGISLRDDPLITLVSQCVLCERIQVPYWQAVVRQCMFIQMYFCLSCCQGVHFCFIF